MVYLLSIVSAVVIGYIMYRLRGAFRLAREHTSAASAVLAGGIGRLRHAVDKLSAPRTMIMGLLAVLLVATAFTFGSLQSTNTVTLPIEVIGPDGTTRSTTVYASNVSNVQSLYVQAYSIGYPDHVVEGRGYNTDKASIRINGGAWVDINNQNVNCQEPEASIGCVTGPYHTIRFQIPISTLGELQSGSNTIEFRFNYASPDVSTGYRILDLQLQRGNGADAIDGTEFVWDDPAEWRPPTGYDNEGDIQAGRDLWHQRDLLVDHWGGPNITASCADCHADNGRDLQYFAFSNESIVARSQFHDLSEKQGKQIAAYIRSIELQKEDGSTYDPPGRPWEPPYQPGPTALATRDVDDPRTVGQSFDDIDQQYWAAGAGLDWVFDEDAETYAYLFPGGPSYDDVDPEQRKLNMRTLPLALQMPDWNEWLPVHHPIDAFSDFQNPSGSSGGRCRTERQEAWSYYNDQVRDISSSTSPSDIESRLDIFFNKTNDYRRCKDPVSGVDNGMARTSLIQWSAIKMWETLHTHALEDLGPELYSEGEPLSWPGQSRVMFNIAPHIIKYPDGGPEAPKGDEHGVTDVYYDTAWYQHQMTLNAGHNSETGLKPVDWKYHFQHARWYHGTSQRDQMVRYFASFLKLLQTAELAPADARPNEPEGWYLRHLTPAWILDKEESDITQHPQEALNDVATNGRCHMTQELMRLFVNGMTEEPMSEWLREEGREGIEPASFTPTANPDPLIFDNSTYANHIYRAIPILGEIGVSSDIMYDLADWADQAWPNANPSFRDRVVDNASCGSGDDPAPSFNATVTAPIDNKTVLAPASLTINAEAAIPPGRSVNSVTFHVDGESIGEDTSEPYTFDWEGAPAGTYELTVEVTDDQDATTVSPPVTVDVISPSAGSIWYEYYEGSWTEIPDFDALTSAASGVASGFDLDVREREDNFVLRYSGTLAVPTSGTYTFYTSSDDGSKLWIDDSLVVDNGGTHALQEKQGAIELDEGKHRITVGYLEAQGQQELTVSWSGPALAKEPLPVEQLSPGQFQTLNLSHGWNLISTRITPFTTQLDSLFGDAADDIVLMKDGAGNTYVPEYGINTIGDWEPLEAYMVYVTDDRQLAIEGMPLSAAETGVPLDAGWNLVSYLPTTPGPIEEAFASLDDVLVMVKDYAGDVYLPDYGINSIGQAEPGQGYKVYVTEEATLTYPSDPNPLMLHAEAGGAANSTNNGPADANEASSASAAGVPSSAVLLLEAEALREGASISVWSDDRMLDRAAVQDGRVLLTIPGDAEATDEQEGARPGDELTLKHEQDGQTQELPASSMENVLTGASIDGPIRYDAESFLMASAAATPSLPLELAQNYPNPFSESTTIEYTIPSKQSVRIDVFDTLGRRVKTLVDEVKEPGAYTLELNAQSLSSGMYFYRIETDDGVKSHQMTVVR